MWELGKFFIIILITTKSISTAIIADCNGKSCAEFDKELSDKLHENDTEQEFKTDNSITENNEKGQDKDTEIEHNCDNNQDDLLELILCDEDTKKNSKVCSEEEKNRNLLDIITNLSTRTDPVSLKTTLKRFLLKNERPKPKENVTNQEYDRCDFDRSELLQIMLCDTETITYSVFCSNTEKVRNLLDMFQLLKNKSQTDPLESKNHRPELKSLKKFEENGNPYTCYINQDILFEVMLCDEETIKQTKFCSNEEKVKYLLKLFEQLTEAKSNPISVSIESASEENNLRNQLPENEQDLIISISRSVVPSIQNSLSVTRNDQEVLNSSQSNHLISSLKNNQVITKIHRLPKDTIEEILNSQYEQITDFTKLIKMYLCYGKPKGLNKFCSNNEIIQDRNCKSENKIDTNEIPETYPIQEHSDDKTEQPGVNQIDVDPFQVRKMHQCSFQKEKLIELMLCDQKNLDDSTHCPKSTKIEKISKILKKLEQNISENLLSDNEQKLNSRTLFINKVDENGINYTCHIEEKHLLELVLCENKNCTNIEKIKNLKKISQNLNTSKILVKTIPTIIGNRKFETDKSPQKKARINLGNIISKIAKIFNIAKTPSILTKDTTKPALNFNSSKILVKINPLVIESPNVDTDKVHGNEARIDVPSILSTPKISQIAKIFNTEEKNPSTLATGTTEPEQNFNISKILVKINPPVIANPNADTDKVHEKEAQIDLSSILSTPNISHIAEIFNTEGNPWTLDQDTTESALNFNTSKILVKINPPIIASPTFETDKGPENEARIDLPSILSTPNISHTAKIFNTEGNPSSLATDTTEPEQNFNTPKILVKINPVIIKSDQFDTDEVHTDGAQTDTSGIISRLNISQIPEIFTPIRESLPANLSIERILPVSELSITDNNTIIETMSNQTEKPEISNLSTSSNPINSLIAEWLEDVADLNKTIDNDSVESDNSEELTTAAMPSVSSTSQDSDSHESNTNNTEKEPATTEILTSSINTPNIINPITIQNVPEHVDMPSFPQWQPSFHMPKFPEMPNNFLDFSHFLNFTMPNFSIPGFPQKYSDFSKKIPTFF